MLPIQYRKKNCKYCGEEFTPVSACQQVCKKCNPFGREDLAKYKKKYYELDIKNQRAKHRVWGRNTYARHREAYITQSAKRGMQNYNELRNFWGVSIIRKQDPLWPKKVQVIGNNAELTAMNILLKEGFQNVEQFKYTNFPFDLRADKAGKISVFEVTANVMKRIHGKFRVANLLGVEFFVLFVSTKLKVHYMIEIKEPRKTVRIPMKFLREVIKSKSAS
jgi:hypothetical protein